MLDRISLTRFRNHEATELGGTSRFNLLVGENGAGKTNVLEALSLLSPGRGLRRAALADMVQHGADEGFGIGASLGAGEEEPVRLATYSESGHPGRRKVRINGAESTATALGEWIALTWLTPAMDGLFTGPAADRRRFVDRMALALDPSHAAHAARYEAALRERNRLLSDDRPPESGWLDAIETQMVEHGGRLIAGRASLVDTLMARIAHMPSEPFARPALTYAPGGADTPEALSQALFDGRQRDRAAQRTLVGPHRDELEVVHAAKRVPAAQSSTGEQKAMLVAITLAHAALAAQGRAGVLLLDEVAAHLDPVRRAALFDQLAASGAQVWMTGTEVGPFDSIADDAAIWRVSGGAVERA
ncbi:DNA replication/repair protein RecF [Qipengyuania sp. 1NDH17]|uniref:DNA replication and repair protein RecF n=1 Tax=Qipengyuania polymorpha TaxID=2867234 RepID=A0ABS7IZX4_9SPHN|nr:DNA replication/repair protein RecF [Qipengyuania polymorpha]MBX7457875.1 DNA replication/repair protein RecF [Qipengyuania polymorpha]